MLRIPRHVNHALCQDPRHVRYVSLLRAPVAVLLLQSFAATPARATRSRAFHEAATGESDKAEKRNCHDWRHDNRIDLLMLECNEPAQSTCPSPHRLGATLRKMQVNDRGIAIHEGAERICFLGALPYRQHANNTPGTD